MKMTVNEKRTRWSTRFWVSCLLCLLVAWQGLGIHSNTTIPGAFAAEKMIDKTGDEMMEGNQKQFAIYGNDDKKLDAVVLTVDRPGLETGEKGTVMVEAYTTGGQRIDTKKCIAAYETSDYRVAGVDARGNITAASEGTAWITVTLRFEGASQTASAKVTVTDHSEPVSAVLLAPERVFEGGKGTLTPVVLMGSGARVFVPASSVRYNVVSADPKDAVTLSEDGMIKGTREGFYDIEAIVDYKGKTMTTERVTVSVVAAEKKGLTIWTEEDRQNAKENIDRYGWAKVAKDKALAEAGRYVGIVDKLYQMVVAEGLPRYYFVGEALDPERFYCRYCKTNIAAKYGLYSWIVDPVNDPWKIKCPECKRRFPSNDFGAFYELGKDEHGIFQAELAHQRNDELIAMGEPGYLVNRLYPEKGKGWGVDDGFGYFPGNTYDNGVVERHNYIAYYLHEGLWHGGVIDRALQSLTYAYLYTGDLKYGRAGAILLDRVADLYPGLNWQIWRQFRGDGYKGKVLDVVWENFLAQVLAEAYDAFFPVFEDPEVIAYLSEKAIKLKLDNPKDCAAAIRKNIEEGILYEIAAASMDGRIAGNFGMTQLAVTTAAVALDTMPSTGKWLDWIMKPGENEEVPRPAGNVNIMQKLVDIVDRDGMGDEASPGYNSLWLTQLLGVAELLNGYETYPGVDLYKNPKFVNMFMAQLPLIMAGYYTAQIGDSGGTASTGFVYAMDTALTGFMRTGNPELAKYVYRLNKNKVTDLHDDITAKDPEKVQKDILDVIERYGPLDLKSDMMTGYGFAVVRDGGYYPAADVKKIVNTQRDFSIYFGIGDSHGHQDALNLGIDAFGLNMAPDLGYPEDTGTQPNRMQWVSKPLSHNTVMVDGKGQKALTKAATPLHFDDAGPVKVMDIDAGQAYPATDIYRRTVVMVEVDDTTSYGVDFFRILGGSDHLYSFHSQSDQIFETSGLELVSQTDKAGNFVGTYASPDVPWGKDPKTVDTSWSVDMLKYPPGTTWLDRVRRDTSPEPTFSVDFKVKDFRWVLPHGNMQLHLRMTMLNDFVLDEVAIARGLPPQVNTKTVPSLEYVLARRTGKALDTLFTTVFEPYSAKRFIGDGMTGVAVEVVEGQPGSKDVVKAIRIPLENGRTDYVVYATNNKVLYRVDGLFDFRGFVGVYSVAGDKPVLTYVNDGDRIGDSKGHTSACTGIVKDFTRELSLQNSIIIKPDQKTDPDALVGRHIYVQNDGVQNAVYEIIGAKKGYGEEILLDIGGLSPVRAYKDITALDKGFVYNITEGQSFRIPFSYLTDFRPVFESMDRIVGVTKTRLTFAVSAKSESGKALTYEAVALPTGAVFDPAERTVTWTPESYHVGEHHVAISASDGEFTTIYHAVVSIMPKA